MGYCDLEIPEHKTQLNFHQKETQHKSTKQNIIEQSQQGLQTKGVRCQAEGQEEEGELGKWKGGREGGQAGMASRTPPAPQPGNPLGKLGLTFVLGSEFPHLGRKGLVELMLPWDQGLAQSGLVEAEHAGVSPNLVDKGLQQDALGVGLCVHGPEGWAHPLGPGGREKAEAAGVLRPARPPSVLLFGLSCLACASQDALPETNTIMTRDLETDWDPP